MSTVDGAAVLGDADTDVELVVVDDPAEDVGFSAVRIRSAAACVRAAIAACV